MNTLEELAYSSGGFVPIQVLRALVQFAKVGSRTESALQRAVENQGVGVVARSLQVGDELFQLLESQRADFIAGSAVQRQFNDAVF